MTICIAAICDRSTDPKILFCADRLISAGIQFESGSSKVIRITDYCYVLHASDDSLFSERVLKKVRERVSISENQLTIKQIVDIFCEECIALKQAKIEKDIISKYNFAVEKVKADPNRIVDNIMDDIEYYQYPAFEFIIAGMDSPEEPHIYKVIQEGDWTCWDSLGFVTIGSGQNLAFPEMTKWYYSTSQPMTVAISRIYFAKKVAERVQGVGRSTDLGCICHREDTTTKEMKVKFYDISADVGFMERLNKAFDKLTNNEAEIIRQLANEIQQEIDGTQTVQDETITST